MTLPPTRPTAATSAGGAPDEDPGPATYTYLCIGCPLGCRLEVDESPEGDIVEVRGFACRRGKEHAVQEHTDPRRMVTTTVTATGGIWPRLPVRTAASVPKGAVREVCRALADIEVTAPVHLGDVVARDVAGTGVDVIATRDLDRVTPVG